MGRAGQAGVQSYRAWPRPRRADARRVARHSTHRRLPRRRQRRARGNQRAAARRARSARGRMPNGPSASTTPRPARRSSSPTNSSIACRSANSCAAKMAGARSSSALSDSDELTFGLSAALPAPDSDDEIGAVREIAPALQRSSTKSSNACTRRPAARSSSITAIVRPEGADTLQALKRHKKVDPLDRARRSRSHRACRFRRLVRLAEEAGLAVAGPVTAGLFPARAWPRVAREDVERRQPATRRTHRARSAPPDPCRRNGRSVQGDLPLEPQLAAPGGLLNAHGRRATALDSLRAWRSETRLLRPRGGVSTGIYASLNAGPGSRDDAAAVAENRRRIAAAFGAQPEQLVSVHQVHSPDRAHRRRALLRSTPRSATRWSPPRPASCSARSPPIARPCCSPIHRRSVIAAAHAGWSGALAGVLENAVARMCEAGAERSRIAAAIGPCIHQKSYEVGPEFEAEFIAADPAHRRFFVPGAADRRRFDLPGFCAERLRAQGLNAVEVLPHDTYAEGESLFSHRRGVHDGASDYGRNCAAISL